ncbi:universal stress protein [Agromyces sp. Marseille-P2726]|uniref:universal stress protein n=1 Tax=Agromyces sp. Marseille-P2726 TaxID=2709132 RepID=UPI00156E8442|nr:universal stress protein [Agromyces sp. Marseille-P2726]
MSEIVVGANIGGPAALAAVRWAAERASARGIRLRLVYTLDGQDTADEAARAEVEQAALRSLDEARAAAIAVDPDVEIVTDAKQGQPVEVFDRLSGDADLLVVGSDWHGGNRASRRRLTSLRIAAGSKVPVAVIPDIDVSGRRGVAVGVDRSRPSDAALAFAVDEATRRKVPLIAVHAWDVAWNTNLEYGYGFDTPATDDLSRAAEALLDEVLEPVIAERPDLQVRKVVVAGDPVEVLGDAAEDADLLVVGSHGRGALARFLLGSVSHGILTHLDAPTVIVR